MGLEDRNAIAVSPGRRPLVMCSRPGYYSPRGASREACRAFVEEAHRAGITAVVVLMTEEEIGLFYGFDLCALYASAGLDPIHFPIDDGSVPLERARFHSLVQRVWDRLATAPVLVHCNAGLGRTGVLAAGLLVLGGARADAAIARVREARPGTLENRGQEQFLRDYARGLRGDGGSGSAAR